MNPLEDEFQTAIQQSTNNPTYSVKTEMQSPWRSLRVDRITCINHDPSNTSGIIPSQYAVHAANYMAEAPTAKHKVAMAMNWAKHTNNPAEYLAWRNDFKHLKEQEEQGHSENVMKNTNGELFKKAYESVPSALAYYKPVTSVEDHRNNSISAERKETKARNLFVANHLRNTLGSENVSQLLKDYPEYENETGLAQGLIQMHRNR
jgi:hypothetical protein